MKFIIFQAMILTMIFSGCSTVTEYLQWGEDKPKEVLVVEEEYYGVATYIYSDDLAVLEKRKKDALNQMDAECNEKYEVKSENIEESATISISNSSGENFKQNIKKVTIKFICTE
jgi:hypothetical protein